MKIKLKPTTEPEARRVVKRFAWFPFVAENKDTGERVFVWLETYSKHQVYTYDYGSFIEGYHWKTLNVTL